MLRRIAAALVRSLIVLIAFSMLFSLASPGFAQVVKGSLLDMFAHASPDAQDAIVDNLDDACATTREKSAGVIQGQQLCDNQSLRLDLEEQCARYGQAKQAGAAAPDEELDRTCLALKEGALDEFCSRLEEAPFVPDFAGMEQTCAHYKEGKLAKRELFGAFISSMIGKGDLALSKLPMLGEIPLLQRLTAAAAALVGILLLLLAALYLLAGSTHAFIRQLAGMLLSVGLLLLIPYAVSSAYLSFGEVDTSPFLRMLSSEQEPVIGAVHVASLLLLVLKNFYDSTLLMAGIACVILGLGGKILARGLEPEPPKSKQPRKRPIHKDKRASIGLYSSCRREKP